MANREETRWCALTDGSAGAVFIATGDMAVSALPYTDLDMALAGYIYQLPPAGDTVLHLDAKMSGLGGATPTANPQQSEHRGHLRMAISRVIRTESVHGQWFPAHPLLSILTVRLRIHSVRVAQEEGPPARRLGESS